MSLSSHFSNSYFYGIAINSYDNQGIDNLKSPQHDIEGIRYKLEHHCNGFQSYVLDENATTREGILTFLEMMVEKVNFRTNQKLSNKNRLILYFAGHGKTLENSDGTATGYLIPKNAQPDNSGTWISMDLLMVYLNKLECRHLLVILDCCFAGSLEWAVFNWRNMFTGPQNVYQQHFDLYVRDKAWQVITSSAFDQAALDYGWRNRGDMLFSPFAKALMDALDGGADLLQNGLITASMLAIYLRNAVQQSANTQNIQHRQTPKLFNLKNHDKGEFLFLNPQKPLKLKDAVLATANNNPFKGLESYDVSDEDKYYGRERIVATITDIIENRIKEDLPNLLVVTGVSGSGKSSVVQAGVVPRIKRKGWTYLGAIRPGERPMNNFSQLQQKDSVGKRLVVIDQFEELVTLSKSKQESKDFVSTLYSHMKTDNDLFVIITLRSDFQHVINKGEFSQIWSKICYSIPWFTREELRDIIVRPAMDIAFFYEPTSLVDTIIDDVLQFPGSLPLLSVLLSELYSKSIENARNRLLHKDDYEKYIGGVSGALHSKLKALLGPNDENEEALRVILLRMVNTESGIHTKKKVNKVELTFNDPFLNGRINKCLDALLKERIIHTVDAISDTWEPVHDAVVKWEKIKLWIEQIGASRISIQKELEADIDTWEANGKKLNDLWYNNDRLKYLVIEVENYKHTNTGALWPLNAQEIDYINLSEQLRNKRRRRTVLSVSSVIIILSFATGYAIFYANEANKERVEANTQKVKAEENLKNYMATKFQQIMQEGDVFLDAAEYQWASKRYDSAYSILEQYKKDSFFVAEATRFGLSNKRKKMDTILKKKL